MSCAYISKSSSGLKSQNAKVMQKAGGIVYKRMISIAYSTYILTAQAHFGHFNTLEQFGRNWKAALTVFIFLRPQNSCCTAGTQSSRHPFQLMSRETDVSRSHTKRKHIKAAFVSGSGGKKNWTSRWSEGASCWLASVSLTEDVFWKPLFLFSRPTPTRVGS